MSSHPSQAIVKVDPGVSDDTVNQMISFADKNSDGRINFDEFCKVMLYKPESS